MITKAEKIQAKMNEQVKAGTEPQPSTSYNNKSIIFHANSPIKSRSPFKWDKTILESSVSFMH